MNNLFDDDNYPDEVHDPDPEPDPRNDTTGRFEDLSELVQTTIFGDNPDDEQSWTAEWKGMPEFSQEDQDPWKSVLVHFATQRDYEAFQCIVGQQMTFRTRSIWYPKAEIGHFIDKRYADEDRI